VAPGRSLRELTGADEPDIPPPPAVPERRAERTPPSPAPLPAAPRQSESQDGAARSMARMIAEIEAGGTPINRRPAGEQQQAALPPEEPRRPRPPQELSGDDFADCERCPVMSVVTATDFLRQGTRPSARQSGGRNMAVSKYEVTIGEWAACAQEGACRGVREHNGDSPERPVVNVTREDAAEYAAWLSRKTGRSYRLMKVGGWSAGGASQRQGAPNDAQDDDTCGGADWRWLDDPDCTKRSRDRARTRENASARQQPFESSSGFRVTRTLGPDG
jgi:formylglycine-generating enzyme required for sulfatase activity